MTRPRTQPADTDVQDQRKALARQAVKLCDDLDKKIVATRLKNKAAFKERDVDLYKWRRAELLKVRDEYRRRKDRHLRQTKEDDHRLHDLIQTRRLVYENGVKQCSREIYQMEAYHYYNPKKEKAPDEVKTDG